MRGSYCDGEDTLSGADTVMGRKQRILVTCLQQLLPPARTPSVKAAPSTTTLEVLPVVVVRTDTCSRSGRERIKCYHPRHGYQGGTGLSL